MNGFARTNHLKKHVREGVLAMSTILWPHGEVELRFETIKKAHPTADPFLTSQAKVTYPSIDIVKEIGTSD